MANEFGPNLLGMLPYRMFGEVDSPTNAQGMMAPNFGGSAQQAGSFMQSPGMQHQMQQFGMQQQDPSQLRQSPFLPNQFMQQHPRFGGAMTGALANVAATPNPQLVQGFGAGMNQMAQGMGGGPEMLRQYQIRQMMAPLMAQGMMMPAMEMERKQQLLQMMQGAVAQRGELAQQGLQQQGEYNQGRLDLGADTNQTKQNIAGGDIRRNMIAPQGAGGIYQQNPGDLSQAPQFHPYDTQQIGKVEEAKEGPKRKTKTQVQGLANQGKTDVADINARGKVATKQAKPGVSDLQGGAWQDKDLQAAKNEHDKVIANIQATITDKGQQQQAIQQQEQKFQQQLQGINQRYQQNQQPPQAPQGMMGPGGPPPPAPQSSNRKSPRQGQPQPTQQGQPQGQPSPQTHSFSKSAWMRANPKGDVNAAAAAAQQAGFAVSD
jgi:hypothetical protein